MSRTFKAVVVLFAALASPPGTAWAQTSLPQIDVKQIEVAYGDLDLLNATGAKKMLHRIMTASKRACGPSGKELEVVRSWKTCVATAAGTAVAQLNAPMVTALYSPTNENKGRFASAATPAE